MPIRRNPQRVRERILEAATDEFAKRGLAGARVDAIVRRAGVNKRMVYHYFGNKLALYRKVLQVVFGGQVEDLRKSMARPAGAASYWFRYNIEHPRTARLLMWEALEARDQASHRQDPRREVFQKATDGLKSLQDKGDLTAKFEPSLLLTLMVGASFFPPAFPQLTRMITGSDAGTPEFQHQYERLLDHLGHQLGFEKAGRSGGSR